MKEVSKPPFQSVYKAISFYLHNNPARQKFFNVCEPERAAHSNVADDFSGESPRDLWVAVLQSIRRTLTFHTSTERAVFARFYCDISNASFKSMDEICKDLCISRSSGYRALNDVLENLERELTRRRLLSDNNTGEIHED